MGVNAVLPFLFSTVDYDRESEYFSSVALDPESMGLGIGEWGLGVGGWELELERIQRL